MIRYSILRPLKESEEFLEECLESAFLIDNIYETEILFAADEQCLATEIARKVCAKYPQVPSRIIIDSKIYCENPKLGNLMKMWLEISGNWVLMVDSNILLPHDTMCRLFSVWNPSVGIVCSPPLGIRPKSFWAWVEVAFLNTFAAKWERIADFIGYGFVQGKVMLVEKPQFEKIGGLEALASEPCEDGSATKLVREADLKVRVASTLFQQPLGHRSFQSVWGRQIRWAKLRRWTFPFWYSLEIFFSALPNLLLLLFFPHNFFIILLFWASSYTGEMLLASFCKWPRVLPMDMLVRDFLMIAIWTMGWFGTDWDWNGKKIRLK